MDVNIWNGYGNGGNIFKSSEKKASLKKILNYFKTSWFYRQTPKGFMPLRLYSHAPDFTLQTAENETFQLREALKDSQILLFFYPKAFTAGCSAEVCEFRDHYPFFSERNIRLVGISHDPEDTQARFAKKYQLPFTLLSDPMRTVCRLYDAVYPFGLLTKRVSYFINQEGIITIAYENLFKPEVHLMQMKNRILSQENNQEKVKTSL